MATHTTKQKKAASATHARPEPTTTAPLLPSADELSNLELKLVHDVVRHRKMARKGSGWRSKQVVKAMMKEQPPNWGWASCEQEDGRHARPDTGRVVDKVRSGRLGGMRLRGNWQAGLEDDHGEEVEGGWVEDVQSVNAEKEELDMAELLKTAKTRKTKKKEDDFEVVRGGVHSVIVLDDQATPEVEADEPWELVESDDDEEKAVVSYADIVANAGT